MEQVTLPVFYCPFPPEIHPRVEQVHAHTFNWARSHRLLQRERAIHRFHTSRFAWLAARVHARAHFEELALTNDFFTWLFLLDDQFDDSSAGRQPERMRVVVERLLAVVGIASGEAVEPLQGPVADALRDLWERARPLSTPCWRLRFARHLRAYLEAYLWETDNRAQRRTPELATYIQKRQDAGAMHLALDYIDLAECVELPPEVYEGTLMQALLLAINNIVCWQNDIVSVEKELAHGDFSNLVPVLSKAYGYSLQEAVERANDLITTEVRVFEHLAVCARDLLPAYRQEVERYLVSMRAWVRGNLDWSLETLRFREIEPLTEEQEPGYLETILENGPVG